MTPTELREYAQVMREMGVFKMTVHPDGSAEIELSQHAIVAGQSEALARVAPEPEPETSRPKDPEEDPWLYAATEGMPT